jgi:hypothetical protein
MGHTGGMTFALPAPQNGLVFEIADITGGLAPTGPFGPVTFVPPAGKLLDGSPTGVANTSPYGWTEFESDGNNWFSSSAFTPCIADLNTPIGTLINVTANQFYQIGFSSSAAATNIIATTGGTAGFIIQQAGVYFVSVQAFIQWTGNQAVYQRVYQNGAASSIVSASGAVTASTSTPYPLAGLLVCKKGDIITLWAASQQGGGGIDILYAACNFDIFRVA